MLSKEAKDVLRPLIPTRVLLWRNRARTCIQLLRILDEGYGHWESRKRSAVINSDGQPIPWYSYPALEYLDQIDFSDKTVFEWGAGYSSLYWARVAKRVTSIEDDMGWFQKLEEDRPCNLTIHLIQNKRQYINAIAATGPKYDVIIIDGSYRYGCACIAPRYLAGGGGLIVLDNSDWYPESAKALRSADLLQVDMTGFAPRNNWTQTTSLFFDRSFRMSSKEQRQPRHGIGARLRTRVEDESEITSQC